MKGGEDANINRIKFESPSAERKESTKGDHKPATTNGRFNLSHFRRL